MKELTTLPYYAALTLICCAAPAPRRAHAIKQENTAAEMWAMLPRNRVLISGSLTKPVFDAISCTTGATVRLDTVLVETQSKDEPSISLRVYFEKKPPFRQGNTKPYPQFLTNTTYIVNSFDVDGGRGDNLVRFDENAWHVVLSGCDNIGVAL